MARYVERLKIEFGVKIDLEVTDILDMAVGRGAFGGYAADELFPEDVESFAGYLAPLQRHLLFFFIFIVI